MIMFEIHQKFKGHFLNKLGFYFKSIIYLGSASAIFSRSNLTILFIYLSKRFASLWQLH